MEDQESVNKENVQYTEKNQPENKSRRKLLKLGLGAIVAGPLLTLGVNKLGSGDSEERSDTLGQTNTSTDQISSRQSEAGSQKTEETPEDKEGELYMSLLGRYIDITQYPKFWEGVFGAIETRDSEESDPHIELKSVMNAARTVDQKILDYRISKDKTYPSLGMTVVERNYLGNQSTISLSIDLNDLNQVQYGQVAVLSSEQKKEMIDKILTRDNMRGGEWVFREQQGAQFNERVGENSNGVKFRQIFSNDNDSFSLLMEYPYEASIPYHFFKPYSYKPDGGPTV